MKISRGSRAYAGLCSVHHHARLSNRTPSGDGRLSGIQYIPLEEFVALLRAHGSGRLVDVRAIPRSLIGDALVVRGIVVKDIMGAGSVKPHLLTAMARVEGGSVTYPAQGGMNSVDIANLV
ncbi:hypothetical protein [Geobacter pickeringii]|uniref:hypothetical protein n=1 Tax=Geobacter pickeringii TaxID=345632 RepID=UPI00191C05C6|nr:hypothetical protein [Geobacter pickeringii]